MQGCFFPSFCLDAKGGAQKSRTKKASTHSPALARFLFWPTHLAGAKFAFASPDFRFDSVVLYP